MIEAERKGKARAKGKKPASRRHAGRGGMPRRRTAEALLPRKKKYMWLAALVGALLAAFVTVYRAQLRWRRKAHRTQARASCHAVGDPQFRRELGTLLGPPILAGNRVVNLENGVEIFPAMLDAIRQARRTINFETYIYWSGEIGREFVAALAERARAGVEVQVLIDWVGSQKMDHALLDELKAAGAKVERYHPLEWYHLARMNNRTHRKLLVVDGQVGFTGGVGIADNWGGNADSPDHWRDSHYRIEGPAVAQMQAAFLDNWIKTTGAVLQGEGYFPALAKRGRCRFAGLHRVAERRRRQHAAHVPARHHCRRG